MLKKLGKLILIAGMIITMIPAQMFHVLAAEGPVNLALNRPATASERETAYWDADKAVDGIVNRDAPSSDQSRWGSNQLNDNRAVWLKVDLEEEKTFQSFVIAWERRNILGYKIQISTDGTSWNDVYAKTDTANEISHVHENIHLATPVTARYVRLYVDGYNGAHVVGGGDGWKSVSLYEFQVYENEIPDGLLPDENYHLEGTASASNVEANNNAAAGAQRAIDGDKDTRWTTDGNASMPVRTLTVTLPVSQRLQFFHILWERENITNYEISVSDDGTQYHSVYTKSGNDAILSTDELISLDAPVWGKYIQLEVSGYTGGDSNWKNVSIAEFEAYAIKPRYGLDGQSTAQEVANGLGAPTIQDNNLVFAKLPEGFEVEVYADYEQIIAKDGSVHQPLTDTQVQLLYQVKKVADGTKAEATKEVAFTVPGLYPNAGTNTKPVVIPELAEWYGTTGDFSIQDGTKIMVETSLSDAYVEVANALAQDYYEKRNITLQIERGTTCDTGNICFFKEQNDEMMGEEGYVLETTDTVTISAIHETGAYWATRTILQIAQQNNDTLPKGITRDYPKFKVRGFMIDVARKPISMESLNAIAKEMAYYKMNDLQVHLNDKLIFMEDYADLQTAMDQAYTGFRLESEIKKGGDGGKNQADLTNTDLHYTKDEFRQFITSSKKMGINVIPEFDTPGHSGAFIKVRPDLHLKNLVTNPDKANRAGEQFDLSDEHYADSFGFVKQLWDEYLNEDMFDSSMTVNIGTDEYYGNKEAFRKFSDDLIEYVQSTGRTVRMWGSLSGMPGTTPVRSEGVQVNIWNSGVWAKPADMYRDGYDLINMEDNSLYIVPDAGYYNDYLNTQNLFASWKPNKFSNVTIPAGSDQMLGAAYAIWNDNIDTKADGNSELDIYDRFIQALPTISVKCWGDGTDYTYAQMNASVSALKEAPGVNAYYKASAADGNYMKYEFTSGKETKDSSNNGRDIIASSNVAWNNHLELLGGSSYVETPIQKLAVGNTLAFDIKLTQEPQPGDILFEADTEGGSEYSHDIRIMSDGTLGYTRELYAYSFHYTLPVGRTVHLEISTEGTKATLYVDGEAFAATGNYVDAQGRLKKENVKRQTLLLPLKRIGSKTNAIEAVIDHVEVKEGAYVDPTLLDPTDFTITSDNENTITADGIEGPISLAFDQNQNTRWHTNYSPYQDLPATITIDMKQSYDINKMTYLPRQDGNANGQITQYSLYYSTQASGEDWNIIVEHATWEANASLKVASFEPVSAQRLKFVAEKGVSNAPATAPNYASASEFTIHQAYQQVISKDQLASLMEEASAVIEENYTTTSYETLQQALSTAQAVYDNASASDNEIAEVYAILMNAIDSLVDDSALKASIADFYALNKADYEASSYDTIKALVDGAAPLLVNGDKDAIAEASLAISNGIRDLRIGYLTTMVEQTSSRFAENYTEASWSAYESAITEAQAILDTSDATLHEIAEAIVELTTKANALELKTADKTALQALLQDCDKLEALLYTASSWEAFQTTLTETNETYLKNDATVREVRLATEALTQAKTSLVERGDVLSLQVLINSYEESDYTAESWALFAPTLAEASALIDLGAEATKTACEAMKEKLQAEAEKLVVLTTAKQALTALIQEYEALDAAAYTSSSYQRLADEMEKAKALLTQTVEDAAYQKAIDECKNLKEALVLRGDITSLATRITSLQAEHLIAFDYTVESWTAYETALNQAQEMVKDPSDVDQTTADEMLAVLNDARDHLTKRTEQTQTDKSALTALLALHTELNEQDYLISSWNAYELMYDKALQAQSSQSITQAEVDALVMELQQAYDGLQRHGDVSELSAYMETLAKQDLIASEYTVESWTAYETALQGAQTVIDEIRQMSQSQVDDAFATLTQAYQKLVYARNTAQLEHTLAQAERIEKTAYTARSYAEFQKAYEYATSIVLDETKKQSVIDEANQALQTALRSLVLRGDGDALQVLIDEVHTLIPDAYTEATWNELQDALQMAESVLNDENADQNAVDEAKHKLSNAKHKLIKKNNPVILEDKKHNVLIQAPEGVLDPHATLQVEPVLAQHALQEVVAKAMEEIAYEYVAYDITLRLEQSIIQPNGMLEVSLPIPEGYDANALSLYHVDEQGKRTPIAFKVEGAYVVFQTDHFSVYVLSQTKKNTTPSTPSDPSLNPDLDQEQPTDDAIQAPASGQLSGMEENTPSTGDATQANLFGMFAIIACMGMGLLIDRKRKQ